VIGGSELRPRTAVRGLAVVLVLFVWSPVSAQIRLQLQGAAGLDGAKPEPPPTYPSDQTVVRSLDDAKKRLAEKSLSAASAALQQIFNHPEETWIQHSDKTWRSAQSVAERTLTDDGNLLADYRSQFEPEAAADLKEAGDDPQKLGAVMRRFFLTRSGAEAAERLGTIMLDQGRPNLAAVYFERLLDCTAHQPVHSTMLKVKCAIAQKLAGGSIEPIVRDAKSKPPLKRVFDLEDVVTFGGRPTKAGDLIAELKAPSFAAETLADWPLPTGNIARTAQSSGGLPLLSGEQGSLARPISDIRRLVNQFDRVSERNRRKGRATFYGAQPIIVGSAAYARTCRGVEAVDLNSGKLLWGAAYAGGEPIDKQELMFDEWEDSGRTFNASAIESFVLGNTIYGSLTSDGKRVYVVDELYVQPGSYNLFVLGPQKADATRRTCNRLTALDAATGKPAWRLGGSEARQAGDPNGQLYFFGPPTPINGKLYVIAELQSEVGLWELDPETGRPLWKQRLLLMHRRVDADPFRRSQACMVVASEGIALCPTNTAKLFAVDLVARLVLWERTFDGDLAQRTYLNFNFIDVAPPPDNPNIADPPIIVGSRVIFQGPNLQGVHCVDLRGGGTNWRRERGGDQHVAGVQQGKVILVGGGRVRALDVENGDETWSTPTPTPAGRGVFANGKYLLPTERGDCTALDLATGKPVGTSLSVDSLNRPLGNLAARDNALVSLGRGGLRVFPLADLIRKEAADLLAKNAKDTRGLYLSGLIALHEQKLELAAAKLLASLRSGVEFAERPQASRTLLRLASEESLGGFSAMDELLAELRKVAKEPRDQAVLLRLEARWHMNANRFAEALVAAEKQALIPDGGLVQSLADASARDRWLWARSFAERVFANAPAGRHAELLRDVERRHADASNADDLEHVAVMYAKFAIGRKARLAIGRRHLLRHRLDLASLAYTAALATAASDDEKAAALSGLAAAADAGRLPVDAYWYLERWKYEAPEGRDGDGRNVSQATAEFIKANGSAAPAFQEPKRWPLAAVRAEVAPVGDRRTYAGRQWIRPTGSDAPYFLRHAFTFRKGESSFVAMDLATMRTDHETTLGEETLRAPGSAVRDSAPVVGYVYYAVVDDKVAALSVLNSGSLVWCSSPGSSDAGKDELDPAVEWSQFMDDRRPQEPPVQVGPAGPDFVVVRSAKELFALDPATGRPLWRRPDAGTGRRLFGDADRIYLVGDRGDYIAIRPSDGEKVEEGKWPWFGEPGDGYSERHCRGRFVLRTSGTGGDLELRLWDPLGDRNLWSRTFPKGSRRWIESASAPIAVATPDGQVQVLDDGTGATITRFKLETPLAPRDRVRALRHGDTILVCVEGGTRRILFSGKVDGVESQFAQGRLYAFKPGGTAPLWEKSVADTRLLAWPLDRLPVLIAFETPEGRRNAESTTTTLRVFEKATGKLLADVALPSELRAINDVAVQGSRSRIELTGWTKRVSLWFDDPSKANRQQPDGPTMSDVGKLMDKFFNRLEKNPPAPMKKK